MFGNARLSCATICATRHHVFVINVCLIFIYFINYLSIYKGRTWNRLIAQEVKITKLVQGLFPRTMYPVLHSYDFTTV